MVRASPASRATFGSQPLLPDSKLLQSGIETLARIVAGGENPRINGASSLLDCAKVSLWQATCWRGWPAIGFDHQGWRSASPL